MENLQWQIEGEFITNMARTWFWDENKPYKVSEDLILSCLSSNENSSEIKEQKRVIALDIIEGRKKFTGINEFQLVDDNNRVRLISTKVDELLKQNEINEIEKKVQYSAIDYIDPYCTVKSLKEAKLHDVKTLDDCIIWFQYSENDRIKIKNGYKTIDDCIPFPEAHNTTMAGLWLVYNPKLIYEASEGGKHSPINEFDNQFWENIYKLTKDNPQFKKRNDYYLANKRVKEENKKYLESLINSIPDIEDEPEFMSDEWFDYKYKTEDDKFSYYLKPDNYEHWEGLIDPDGNFYSCHFGGHNLKSFYLILKYPNKFGIRASGSMLNLEFEIDQKLDVDAGNGLDFIVKHGWCATRYIGGRYFIELPTNNHLTQKQINAIFDASIKHDININEIENFEY